MKEIPAKYMGSCIAMIDDEVVVSGRTYSEVYKKAKMLYPKKLITLFQVPKKNELKMFL